MPEHPGGALMRRVLTAAVVLAAGGAASAFLVNRGDASQAANQTAQLLPVNTAKVTQQTLKDTETEDGELGFGTTSTAVNRTAGTITSLPDSGQELRRGNTVYSVDNKPTTLLYGALPAYRRLADGSEGPDVRQLEQNLKAMGYTGFTVDDEYTSLTAEAVEEWQEDLGLDGDRRGRARRRPLRAGADPGRQRAGAGGLAARARTSRSSPTPAPRRPSPSSWTPPTSGSRGRRRRSASRCRTARPSPGRVAKVSTVIIPAESPDKDPETKVEVIVAIDNQKAVAAWALASVDVTFTASERKNVLTVPVAALVALREGGFGVEVADGTASSYVPVKTGLFAERSGRGQRRGHHGRHGGRDPEVIELSRGDQGLPRRGDRARRCQPAHRPRRAGRDRRPVRLRQVDDAERARHPRPADAPARSGSTGTTSRGCPTRVCRRCGRPGSGSCSSSSTWPPGVRALDNVADGLLYAGLRSSVRRKRAAAALERVGLGHRLDHQPHELSGGERQRVAIARAVAGEPAVLLADEPTGALDSASGAGVMELLRELHAAGTTVVVITHDRDIAAALPRQVRMRDGLILEDDMSELRPARLGLRDVVRVGAVGLRTRPMRAFLSALGIAIGIAAMIAVVGISSSSRAELDRATRRPRHQPAHGRAGRPADRRAGAAAARPPRRWSAGSAPVQAESAVGDGRTTRRSTAATRSRSSRPTASSRTPPARTCSTRSARPSAAARGSTRRPARYPAVGARRQRGRAARHHPRGSGRAGADRQHLVHRARHPRTRCRWRRNWTRPH